MERGSETGHQDFEWLERRKVRDGEPSLRVQTRITPMKRIAACEPGGTGSKRPAKLDNGAYEGLAGFRKAMRRFLAFSEIRLKAAGITSQQYQAMLAIWVHPGRVIMVGELAREMLLRPNGAVQLTDRLVDAGLAERRQSSADRRSVLVALTGKGARLLETLAAEHLNGMLEQEQLLAESLVRLRRLKTKL